MSPPAGSSPRQAILLAAGLGERMLPLTGSRAKPSLPLMNRPLLLQALDHLGRASVRKVVVNVHHAPATIERLLGNADLPAGLTVAISHEPRILGTSGGIRAALPHFDVEAPILVVNADSLSDTDIGALAAAHEAARRADRERRPPPATLAVRDRTPGEPYAPVHLDAAGLLCGIGEAGGKGDPATFIGVHLVAPETVARIPSSGPSDIVRDVYQPLLREGRRLGAHRHRGWWIEIGSPALYLKAHVDLLGEPAFLSSLPASAGALVAGREAVFAGGGCEGLEGARIRASVLGPLCRLGEGCVIEGSVLAAGSRVGRGAQVASSVVWENAEVPDRGSVRSGLVLAGAGPGEPMRVVPL